MIGARLKAARDQAGLSQQRLAEKAGVRQCQISDLEQGKLSVDHVHWGTIRKLCAALELTPNELLGYVQAADASCTLP